MQHVSKERAGRPGPSDGPGTTKPPVPRGLRRLRMSSDGELDGAADGAEDLADLPPQEDQGDDRNDRDQREDQRVLRESLALFVAAEGCNKSVNVRHGWTPPFRRSPRSAEGRSRYGRSGGVSRYS